MIIRWWWKKRNVVRRYVPNWIKYNSCLVPVVYISWSSFHFWWWQIVKGIFVQFCEQGALRGFWQYSKGTLGVFGENMLVPCEVVFESRIFESQIFESAVFESQGSKREMQEKAQVKQLVPVVQIEQMRKCILRSLIWSVHYILVVGGNRRKCLRGHQLVWKWIYARLLYSSFSPMPLKLIISNTNWVKALEFIFVFALCLVS